MASKHMNDVLHRKAELQNTLMHLATNKSINVTVNDGTAHIDAGQKNTADIAARFLIAEQMRSFANKNYDVVKKEAKDAGLFGDEADYVTGETVVLSSFSGFDITAKKASESEYADTTATKNVISKYVPSGKREQALSECIKERKGAVTISVVVK